MGIITIIKQRFALSTKGAKDFCNGETLSGGECQRVSIACALLKDAPIVLLDEATASLDVENETRIQAGISELIRHKTVLVIAHRMRTNAKKYPPLVRGCASRRL